MADEEGPTLIDLAEIVADSLDADVMLYNGDITRDTSEFLADKVNQRNRRRENALLILTTHGGDPHAAYRITRCLQRRYKKLILYVGGVCKSAGTIVATGAHQLVISDHGELGPLDTQMGKKDHLWEMQSGLVVQAALQRLTEHALLAFEDYFISLENRSRGQITVQTAADIAVRLTSGLFTPLAAQIDPIHLGEARRAVQITSQYGTRLARVSKNPKDGAIAQLVENYPAHGFVIDREEAAGLFNQVREPSEAELALDRALGGYARRSLEDPPFADYISPEPRSEPAGQDVGEKTEEDNGQAPRPPSAAGEPSPATGSDSEPHKASTKTARTAGATS